MNPWIRLKQEPTADRQLLSQAYQAAQADEELSLSERSQLTAAYAQALAEIKRFEQELSLWGSSSSLGLAQQAYQNGQASPFEQESFDSQSQDQPLGSQAESSQQEAGLGGSLDSAADAGEPIFQEPGNHNWTGQGQWDQGGADQPFGQPIHYDFEPPESDQYSPLKPRQDYQLPARPKKNLLWRLFGIALVVLVSLLRFGRIFQNHQKQSQNERPIIMVPPKASNSIYDDEDLQNAIKKLDEIGHYQLEDAGDGTQILKMGDKTVLTGIVYAMELQNGDYYLETREGRKVISGRESLIAGEASPAAAYPAWIQAEASQHPNAVAVQKSDGSWVLVLERKKFDSLEPEPVAGSPAVKADKTVDIQGQSGAYSFAP